MAPEKEVESDESSPTDEPNSSNESFPGKGPVTPEVDPAQAEVGSAGPDVSAAEDADGDAGTEAPTSDAANADETVVPNNVDVEAEVDDDGLPERLAAAEARADENWDKFVRLQAEMENQRKRSQKEVSNARKFALEGMVEALLPIRDSLELGLKAAGSKDADVASIREGSELTLKMLAQAFEKFNIEEVNPLDEKFNPEFHQAMSMQAVEGKAPNTVTGVMQKGYTLNERLIRPALVMVAK